jgi:hypothetical protein
MARGLTQSFVRPDNVIVYIATCGSRIDMFLGALPPNPRDFCEACRAKEWLGGKFRCRAANYGPLIAVRELDRARVPISATATTDCGTAVEKTHNDSFALHA